MRALIALSLLTVSNFAAAAPAKALLQCNDDMFNVAILSETSGAQEKLTISISDVSGHGKDYVAVIPAGTSSKAIANGFSADSDQTNMGVSTGKITGTESFQLSGKVGTLKGELPASVQCVDLGSD